MVIVDREMDELMKKGFRDEVMILKDRRTYSIREKEKVWYQNGNKMFVCATLVGGEGVVQVHHRLLGKDSGRT